MIMRKSFENNIFFTNNLLMQKVKSLITCKNILYQSNKLKAIKQTMKLY